MKFVDNYQDRQWGALVLSPQDRDELVRRLESQKDDIEIEDLFEDGSYKIERIRVVTNWSEFAVEAAERDTNVKWTTRAMWAVVLAVLGFAIFGVYSAIK